MATTTQDHALVCRFMHPRAKWASRYLAVTRRPSEDGWFALLRSEWGKEPEVLVHQTTRQCDDAFRATVEGWIGQGFEYDRKVVIPIRTMTVDDSAVEWASSVMNPAVTLLDAWDRPSFNSGGMAWLKYETDVLAWTASPPW